jgi:hypothetical protein
MSLNNYFKPISILVLVLVSGCGGGGGSGKDSSFGTYEGNYRAAIVKVSDNCAAGSPPGSTRMEFYQDRNTLHVNFSGYSYSGFATADSFSVTNEREFTSPQITCLNEATMSGRPAQPGNYEILDIEERIVVRRCNRPTRGCEVVYRGTAAKE